jgi:hypothetical protein
MLTHEALIGRGFFPQELPPPFASHSLAKAVSGGGVLQRLASPAKSAVHNLARSGALRRRLAIPNPLAFLPLATEVATNWPELSAYVHSSPLSESVPIYTQNGRAIVPAVKYGELHDLRAKMRSWNRYVVYCDISQFYHSIYTHSIPWAIHGKSKAKASRKGDLLGNRLDKLVRDCQDGQTTGIPIGPDTSLLLAEVILTAIDHEIQKHLGTRCGFRRVDDYEFCFPDLAAAEEFLAFVQERLSEFQLTLNPRKTRLTELPTPLEPKWVRDIRRVEIRLGSKAQATDLADMFDYAFDHARTNPDEHVLRYALGRLRNTRIHESNWPLAHALILQAAMAEPGTMQAAVELLIDNARSGRKIDRESVAHALNHTIHRNAPMGHGSEVAWAMWGLIALSLRVTSAAESAISRMDDSVAALLALHARERGLLDKSFAPGTWSQWLEADELYGPHWLFAYEAEVKGWLRGRKRGYVSKDPNFRLLQEAGVSFYEDAKEPLKEPRRFPVSFAMYEDSDDDIESETPEEEFGSI